MNIHASYLITQKQQITQENYVKSFNTKWVTVKEKREEDEKKKQNKAYYIEYGFRWTLSNKVAQLNKLDVDYFSLFRLYTIPVHLHKWTNDKFMAMENILMKKEKNKYICCEPKVRQATLITYIPLLQSRRDSFHSASMWWWLMPNERENILFPLEFDQFTMLDITFFFCLSALSNDKWNEKKKNASLAIVYSLYFFSLLFSPLYYSIAHKAEKQMKLFTLRNISANSFVGFAIFSSLPFEIFHFLESEFSNTFIWTNILFWMSRFQKKGKKLRRNCIGSAHFIAS